MDKYVNMSKLQFKAGGLSIFKYHINQVTAVM